MAKSKKAILKHIEELWDDNRGEIARGRSGTEIMISSDKFLQKYIDPKTLNTMHPKVDWKKMAKDDFDMVETYYEDLWHAYT